MLAFKGFIVSSFEMPFQNVISAKRIYFKRGYFCHFKTKVNSTVSTFFHEMPAVGQCTAHMYSILETLTGNLYWVKYKGRPSENTSHLNACDINISSHRPGTDAERRVILNPENLISIAVSG